MRVIIALILSKQVGQKFNYSTLWRLLYAVISFKFSFSILITVQNPVDGYKNITI